MDLDRELLLNFFSDLDKEIEERYGKEILIEIYLLGGAFFVINKLRKLK